MTRDDDAPRPEFGVFHMPPESTLKDVAEHISRMGADRFREVEGFAYILTGEIEGNPDDSVGVLNYQRDRPIYVVDKMGGELRLRRVVKEGLSEAVPDDGLRRIQEADLMDMMFSDGSACIMEPGGNYHFVTPSLMHTNRFLRIGDLIRNRETLDRLAFWIERFVRKAQGLLIDSWSIASLGLRAMHQAGVNIPFDCLPEHPSQNTDACRSVIDKLLSDIPQKGKLLVVISISGSGRLLEQIRAVMPTGLDVSFLSLYGFQSTPAEIECIARINDKEGTYPEADCKFCNDGSKPIPIDPASYHLRSWREEWVMTSQDHCAPGRDFLDRYHDVDNLFFVHRDDPSDQRHHAFDIDVSRLLKIDSFRDRLVELMKRFHGKKDLIVTPSHAVADQMRSIAEEVLCIPALVHDNLYGNAVTPKQREMLENARNLLIVDDTINSGTRLSGYIQALREGQYGPFDTVDYLVAIARPETELELKQASRLIANRHSWRGALHHVEMFLLPRWSGEVCPWCKEFDLLSKLEERYAEPPEWLIRRNQKLSSRGTGIADEPFLLLPGITTPTLGSESVLAKEGISGQKVVFGVASGLQRHRSDREQNKKLHPDYPLANVVNPDLFSVRYTEGLIRAAFLRTITRPEFGNQASIESRDFLLGAMRSVNQKIVVGEMLTAIGRRAFPVISATRFVTSFEDFLPKKDLEMLAEVMELPKP